MADMMATGIDWLAGQLKANASKTVTYRRRQLSVSLSATIGRTTFETADDFGVVQQTESRDFIVEAADLILDGEQTLPMRGDLIEETVAGETHVYETLPLPGEQLWRYSDPHRVMLRIHTKLAEKDS